MFSKDTFDSDDDDQSVYFRTYVTDGHLSCDIKGRPFHDGDNEGTFPVGEWEYYAVSVMMNPDAETSSVRFITGRANTQSTETATTAGEKFVDRADGGASFIGSTRLDADTHTQFMTGFIYNLHIDNGFYQQFTPLHYGIHLDCNCTNE